MGIFDRDYKNSIDEKRYKQILAEEELEEEYFNRKNSFDNVENKIKEKEKEIVEKYDDDIDYDEYSNDYAAFDSVNEDYDKEEHEMNNVSVEKSTKTKKTSITSKTTNSSEEYDDTEDEYVFDKSMIVSIISNIYKWFAIISLGLAVLLILYLLIKAKFIAVFLYIISLVCAFLFGYIAMFAVSNLFFKE